MTVISSGSIALTLLKQTQTSTLSSGARKSATDTIIDIVSTQTKAKAAAKPPRETGGTVSSELSSAQLSGMTAAGRFSVNQTSSSLGFGGYAATVENAKGFAENLISMVSMANAEFHLIAVPTRDEWTATVLAGEADRISRGADVESAKELTKQGLSDESYQNLVTLIDGSNKLALAESKDAKEALAYGFVAGHLRNTFGVDAKISYNERGEAKLSAFEIKYGNGQTMLSYSDEGKLTVYNDDGSVQK